MTCPAAAAAAVPAVPECMLPTFDNTFYRPWAVFKFTAKQNIRDNIIISLQSFPPLLLPLLLPPMAAHKLYYCMPDLFTTLSDPRYTIVST